MASQWVTQQAASAYDTPIPTDGPQNGSNLVQSEVQRIQDAVSKNHSQSNPGLFIATKELRDLQTKVGQGQFSQGDYLSVLDQLMPHLQKENYGLQRISSDFNDKFGDNFKQFTDLSRDYGIYKNFQGLFGRDITPQELAMARPAFQGPNSEINGNAFLANLQQQYKANPATDPGSAQNTQKPADIQGSVQQQFKSVLGRDPTQDELAHFSEAIKSNQTDAYGLGNFLKQMPEYTNQQDSQFRQGLNTELQNYDVQEFGRQKQDIMSDYAKRGIDVGSSPSLDYALTDLMGKIAQNRQAYLAQLSAGQYGGNKDLAVGNYQNTLNQMYNTNQAMRQQQQGYNNALINRGFEGADYQQQMNDYMKYMNANKGQSGNPLYGAVGGLLGAGIGGFATHSPQGAMAGYQIGSGVGNSYGYLNQ